MSEEMVPEDLLAFQEEGQFPIYLYMNEDNGVVVTNRNEDSVEEVEATQIVDRVLEQAQQIIEDVQEKIKPSLDETCLHFEDVLSEICDIKSSIITTVVEEPDENTLMKECTTASLNFDDFDGDLMDNCSDANDLNDNKFMFSNQFPASMNNLYTPMDFDLLSGSGQQGTTEASSPAPKPTPTTPMSTPIPTTSIIPENVNEINLYLNSDTESEEGVDISYTNYPNVETTINSIYPPLFTYNVEPNEVSNIFNSLEVNYSSTENLGFHISEPMSTSTLQQSILPALELDHKPTFIVRPRPGRPSKLKSLPNNEENPVENSMCLATPPKTPTREEIIIVKSPLQSIRTIKENENKMQEHMLSESMKDFVIPLIKHKVREKKNRRKQKHVTLYDSESWFFDALNIQENTSLLNSRDRSDELRHENSLSPEIIEIYKRKKPMNDAARYNSLEYSCNYSYWNESDCESESTIFQSNKVQTDFEKSKEIVSSNYSDTDAESDLKQLLAVNKKSQSCLGCKKYFKSLRTLLKHSKECFFQNKNINFIPEEEQTNPDCELTSPKLESNVSPVTTPKKKTSVSLIKEVNPTEISQFSQIKSKAKFQSLSKNGKQLIELKPNDDTYNRKKEQLLENIGLHKITNEVAGHLNKQKEQIVENKQRPNTRSQTKSDKRRRTMDYKVILRKKRSI